MMVLQELKSMAAAATVKHRVNFIGEIDIQNPYPCKLIL